MGVISLADAVTAEPQRSTCATCVRPVLTVVIADELVIASAYEWQPRARCYECATIERRVNKAAERCPACRGAGLARAGGERLECGRCQGRGFVGGRRIERLDCKRCGGEGYVGENRPPGHMLALDLGWSDEGHVRLIGPGTRRRKGEALYPLHLHAPENHVIVGRTQTPTMEVAA